MGILNFATEKMENAILAGATGFIQSNPSEVQTIGALFDQELSSWLSDAVTPDEVYEQLGRLVSSAQISTDFSDNARHAYVSAGDRCKKAGDKAGMYGFNILAALHRSAIEAATGKAKALARFEEISAIVATSINTFRSIRNLTDQPPGSTLGELIKNGQSFEATCSTCNRLRTIDPSELNLPEDTQLRDVARRMRCTNCGDRAIEIVAR